MPAPMSASHAEAPPSTRDPIRAAPRYRVFLSYSHTDTKWARWLMRRLEGYSVPKRFHGRVAPIGEVGARLAPVFRDRDELPTTSDLGEAVRNALRETATLVVICSPASARSRWVQEEIVAFKRMHGERGVFAFIVSGEPKAAGAADDCFSPALRAELGPGGQLSAVPAEVVAADARAEGDGPNLAFVRLVAGLLGVGFDELRQRELQRRNRRLTWITAGSLAAMALTFSLALVAWQARNDARRRQDQAEQVLAFMLGNYRDELKKMGQVEVLARVGDAAMAYFDSLDARDMTDTALARQAKALTQIGDVRLQQKNVRYADAAKAFAGAYQRAATLAARHPLNGEMLFERAQAEYWIGYVHWKRRNFSAAVEWLTRYRDSTAGLAALDPKRLDWQRERVAGQHNLAVLALERGHLSAAREGFSAALAMNEEMLAANPADAQLRSRVADTQSWLGTVAEYAGDFAEAKRRIAAQIAMLDALVQGDPRTSSPELARWKIAIANACATEATLLAITGRGAEALAWRQRAREISERLVAQDPANRRWLGTALVIRAKEAGWLQAEGRLDEAAALIEQTRVASENLAQSEPTDRELIHLVATTFRIDAELRAASGRPDAAARAARAVSLLQPLVDQPVTTEKLAVSCAKAALVAGDVAEKDGDSAAALRYWQRGLEVAQRFAERSDNWHVADPVARLLARFGRLDESRALIERLTRLGYQPIVAWPEAVRPPVSFSNP